MRELSTLLLKLRIKLIYLIIPATLSLGSALFDGLSAGLLIPLINGLMSGSFRSAYNTPVLKTILSLCPPGISLDRKYIFILIVSLTFTAAVLNHLMRYASVLSTSFLVRRIANTLRKNIFNKYLDQGKEFFDRTNFGHLNNILQTYPYLVSENAVRLAALTTDALTACVFLGMMFVLSWKLTVGVVLTVPILSLVFRRLIEKIRTSSQMYVEQAGKLARKSFGILTCIPLVKLSSLEQKEQRDFANISDAVEKIQFSIDKKTQLIEPLQRIFMLIFIVAAMMIMAIAASQRGSIEVARMLVYFYLLREVSHKIGSFNQLKALFLSTSAHFKQIVEILTMKNCGSVKGGDEDFAGIRDKIEIRNLTFSYGKGKEALKNISFSIPTGKMTAIVGPTGAGKTTIASLLLRLYDCPPGTIFMDGKDLRGFKTSSLMSKIALVIQETYLFNDTLRNNIAYGYKGVSEDKIVEVIKKARLHDFIKSLPEGLETEIGDRGAKLSGGEKQRVSIARAILREAEILILDEATSALDSKTEKLIHEAIEEAAKDKTTIVIAHRLSTIRNADKIVVIEDGAIVEEGVLQQLLDKKGRFYEYWQEQKFF